MPKILLPNDIVNDTPADASPVEQNFNGIESFINSNVIERGGSVAMVAQLKLVGDPIAPLDAAPKQYVDTFMPIGIVMMYGGVGSPPGGRWAECNGAELESSAYPELFAIIGSRFSPAGTPAGRFNLPPLNDHFAIGAGTIAALGKTGGNKDAVVVSHNHPIDHTHAAGTTGNDSPDHTHLGANHGHAINTWTGGESAGHDHWMRGIGDASAAGGFGEGNVADNSNLAFNGAFRTLGNNTGHTHPINSSTDAADRDLTSAGASVRHSHYFATPTFNGSSTTVGVAAANANMPPYVAMTYIMRVA